MRKLLAVLLVAVLCLGITACNVQKTPEPIVPNTAKTAYPDEAVGFQLEAPAVGEQIAIMHTSMGDVYIRLFPEGAPKAVENFVTLSKNGYYNGLTFHRVIEDFMVQGGDPKGTGSGGESCWGEDFEDEFDQKLLNLRGSLAMANSGVNTNGSQFFINQGDGEAFSKSYTTLEAYLQNAKTAAQQLKTEYDQLIQQYGKEMVEAQYGTWDEVLANYSPADPNAPLSQDVWDLYKQHGGNLHLDGAWRRSGGHTVFGQVFRGMDVVDAIAAVETDANDKPTTPVTITTIEITTYQG